METRLSNVDFKPDSYSQKCLELFDPSQEWKSYPLDLYLVESREVEKSNENQITRITQYGEELYAHPGLQHIRHTLFQVAMLSILDTEDKLYVSDRWYVIKPTGQPEFLTHFRTLSPDIKPAEPEELRHNISFAIQSNLYVPNAQDLKRLDSILSTDSEK